MSCFTSARCGTTGVAPKAPEFNGLLELGVCRRRDSEVVANFRVTAVQHLLLLSDTPAYVGNDRVWYPLADESLLMAEHLPEGAGMRALDVGCGSGILALSSAQNGARATALDLSPRAVAMTVLNATLNGLAEAVEACVGDIETFEPGDRFDLLLLNPPFVPMPEGTRYMLSGYGGPDGLGLVHIVLNRLDRLVNKTHLFMVISMSPGDAHVSALEQLLLDRYQGRPFMVDVLDVYGDVSPIERGLAPFRDDPGFASWTAWLAERQYTHLHYLLICVFPSSRFTYRRRSHFPPLPEVEETGSWDAMYRVIENTKRHSLA
jgi:SAM-dependent methyltransferase